MKITEKEFNALTGEETITERNATAKEIADYEAAQAQAEAKAQVEAARAAQKAALLDRLGITEEEAKLLLA
jgi:hypothetical protein